MPKMSRNKKKCKRSKVHSWHKKWICVPTDHAHVKDINFVLILVDLFWGWPEAIKVTNIKITNVKQVLKTEFSRNGVPRMIVTDNAPEFCEDNLCSELKHIGCIPNKTPLYHPKFNGIAERMMKIRLKEFPHLMKS